MTYKNLIITIQCENDYYCFPCQYQDYNNLWKCKLFVIDLDYGEDSPDQVLRCQECFTSERSYNIQTEKEEE